METIRKNCFQNVQNLYRLKFLNLLKIFLMDALRTVRLVVHNKTSNATCKRSKTVFSGLNKWKYFCSFRAMNLWAGDASITLLFQVLPETTYTEHHQTKHLAQTGTLRRSSVVRERRE